MEQKIPPQLNPDFENNDSDNEEPEQRRYPVRANRNVKPQRYFGREWANLLYIADLQSIEQIQTTTHSVNCYRSLYLLSLDDDNILDSMHPYTFAA